MAPITSTASLVARKALFEAALEAVLTGKSYQINGRSLTRADEGWITRELAAIENRLSIRANGGSIHVEQRFLDR